MSSPASCDRCGSTRLRHARSHNFVHRLVRAWSDWDRYACGDCGHRGWRKGRLPRRERTSPQQERSAPGRRLERRDARMRQRRLLRLALTVVVGLALGYLVARFVLRLGAMQPPPPE